MKLLENENLIKELMKECDEVMKILHTPIRLRLTVLELSIACHKLLLYLGEENE